MAKTIISNASGSYCTAAEFLKRAHVPTVGDLVSDTDQRVAASALLSNANLQACLDDAAGILEGAALLGEKYSPEDLLALSTGTTVSSALIRRIMTGLTWLFLVERKPDRELPSVVEASVERSMAWCKKLSSGEMIFGFQETADAGVMQHQDTTPTEVEARNSLVFQAQRYFGRRTDRAPQGG